MNQLPALESSSRKVGLGHSHRRPTEPWSKHNSPSLHQTQWSQTSHLKTHSDSPSATAGSAGLRGRSAPTVGG